MSYKTLSVCLITKNEEHNLVRCINSVKTIADEIILVDTGSTDNTLNIAKKLGVSIYETKWNNSFSEAKNFALEKCTKDWILVIDADEALQQGDDIKLKSFIQNKEYEALYLNLVNLIGSESINETPSLRIFRNRKDYRFKNKLHEQIFPSISAIAKPSAFSSTDITLYHYGYDHNVVDMSKKIQRNINILNIYTEDEKDGLYYFSLGSEYLKINDFANAKKTFIKALSFPDDDGGYKIYLSVTLPKTCLSLNQYITAINYLDKAIETYTDFRDIYFVKAACSFELGKYTESFIDLNLYKMLPPKPNKYPSLNFEQSNNIDTLFETIISNKIPHEINLLAIVINANSKNSSIETTIKNTNEISSYTFVTSDDPNYIFDDNATELGASFFSYTDTTSIINLIQETTSAKWVLFINAGTTLSYKFKTTLIASLENNDLSIISKLPYKLVQTNIPH